MLQFVVLVSLSTQSAIASSGTESSDGAVPSRRDARVEERAQQLPESALATQTPDFAAHRSEIEPETVDVPELQFPDGALASCGAWAVERLVNVLASSSSGQVSGMTRSEIATFVIAEPELAIEEAVFATYKVKPGSKNYPAVEAQFLGEIGFESKDDLFEDIQAGVDCARVVYAGTEYIVDVAKNRREARLLAEAICSQETAYADYRYGALCATVGLLDELPWFKRHEVLLKALEDTNSQWKALAARQSVELEQALKREADLAEELNAAQEDLEVLQARVDDSELKQEIERLEGRITTLEAEVARLGKQVGRLKSENAALRSENRRLQDALDAMKLIS